MILTAPLIAANWKMNGQPDWAGFPAELAAATSDSRAEILICPPHPLIGTLVASRTNADIRIGAQDCSEHEAGAHTGETDAALIRALGGDYVILGHSERRANGETDHRVHAKAVRAIDCGLRPIICVGESLDQREAGRAVETVLSQLEGSLPKEGHFDIAYEPIWAIGTGRTAQADDIGDMHEAIQKAVGDVPRILYGGSVKPANAAEILAIPAVGGALVGGASLKVDSFAAIANAAP